MQLYYLGPEGTFSYQATKAFTQYEPVSCLSFYELFMNLKYDKNGCAIVPIENAIEGTINLIADELIEQDLYVSKECFVDVSFDVVGYDLTKVKRIVSIAPIISQVKSFIQSGQYEIVYSESSIDALNYVDDETAAIVPHHTNTNFKILARHIEDYPGNKTRFLLIGHELIYTGHKSLLLLSPKTDHIGLLANVLNIFNMYQVNLTWITSRPTKKAFGNYHFLLQCNQAITPEHKLISVLSAMDIDVQVLGVFK